MLPNEVAPYADYHIKNLEDVNGLLALIQHTIDRPTTTNPVTSEEVETAMSKISSARRALYRYKMCMADEIKQKERYEKYAKENGYPYS